MDETQTEAVLLALGAKLEWTFHQWQSGRCSWDAVETENYCLYEIRPTYRDGAAPVRVATKGVEGNFRFFCTTVNEAKAVCESHASTGDTTPLRQRDIQRRRDTAARHAQQEQSIKAE